MMGSAARSKGRATGKVTQPGGREKGARSIVALAGGGRSP